MRTRLRLPVIGGLATLLCATALTPLFDGLRWWFGPAIGATVVAVACGALARRLRLPAVLHPALLLAGLAAYTTVVCARDTAWAGLVPTGRTFDALRALADAGGTDVRGLAAPVPERPGLVLFVVLGVYAVAALVDLLAVTARRPSLAGLPLLGLFAVPAAVLPSGVGVVPFLLGGGGYVALLLAEGRQIVGRWGRPLSPAASPEPVETNPLLGATGRRIGMAALASALVVPFLVPGLGSGLFAPKGGGIGGGGGSGSTSVIQPIVALYQQLHVDQTTPLARIATDNPQYLRLTALEQFDGQRFTLNRLQGTKRDRVSRGLPPPDATGVTTTVTGRVEVTDNLAEHYLPVPYAPVRVDRLKGDWRLSQPTRTIFSVHTNSAGASYQVTSEVPAPRPEELRTAGGPVPAELRVDTRLPAGLDPRVARLAREKTAGRTTAYDKVAALQTYLRGRDFTYDLAGAPTTRDGALSEFLFQSRRGYCEQFASAMVVLTRALGIPARVAIGFTPGRQERDGTWTITNKDAHAWPEVWFPGAGWVRFEPTKRDDQQTTAPGYTNPGGLLGAPDTGTPTDSQQPTRPSNPPSAVDRTGRDRGDLAAANPPLPLTDARHRASAGTVWISLGAALLLLLLLAPALVRLVLRRRRIGGRPTRRARGAPSRTRTAWVELVDLATDLGLPMRASDSPRATAARLAEHLPADGTGVAGRTALRRVALAEEWARYAPTGTPLIAAGPLVADVGADVRAVARAMRATAPAHRRVRATIAPPSVVGRARRRAVGGVADVLDSGDRLLDRASIQLGRLGCVPSRRSR